MQEELEEKRMEAELNQQTRQAELEVLEPKLCMELQQGITEALEEVLSTVRREIKERDWENTSLFYEYSFGSRGKRSRICSGFITSNEWNGFHTDFEYLLRYVIEFLGAEARIFGKMQLSEALGTFHTVYKQSIMVMDLVSALLDLKYHEAFRWNPYVRELEDEDNLAMKKAVQGIQTDLEASIHTMIETTKKYMDNPAENYEEMFIAYFETDIEKRFQKQEYVQYSDEQWESRFITLGGGWLLPVQKTIHEIMQPFHEKTQEAETAQKNEHADIATFERNMATEITQKKAGIELKQKKFERLLRNCERDIRTKLERQIRQKRPQGRELPG